MMSKGIKVGFKACLEAEINRLDVKTERSYFSGYIQCGRAVLSD